jgi:hypothetical protein
MVIQKGKEAKGLRGYWVSSAANLESSGSISMSVLWLFFTVQWIKSIGIRRSVSLEFSTSQSFFVKPP